MLVVVVVVVVVVSSSVVVVVVVISNVKEAVVVRARSTKAMIPDEYFLHAKSRGKIGDADLSPWLYSRLCRSEKNDGAGGQNQTRF